MIHYLFSFNKKRQYALFAGDMLVIILSILCSYLIRDVINQQPHIMLMMADRFKPWLLLILFFHWITLYLFDQYSLDRLINPVRSSVAVLLSVWLAGLLIAGVFYFFPKYLFGRQVTGIHLLFLSVSMIGWRLFYTRFLARRGKPRRLALVGDGQILSAFIEEIQHLSGTGFRLHCLCIRSTKDANICLLPESTERTDSLADLLEQDAFDVLAFDSTACQFTDEEIRLILQLKYKGKAVYDLPTLYKNLTGKVPLSYIDGRWLLNSDGLQGELNRPYVRTKRIIDITLSSWLLILLSPLFLFIAIAIKLDSKGSILFIQERLGAHRKPFMCLKFRSMFENSEKESGPTWSSQNDPRITRVGRFLRKTRLDELPQLVNIFKGDMSFVGPRPIRDHFANELAQKIPFYGIRFSVKPGLSGWAQVNFGYAGSEEGQLIKFQYELFYIQNMSLFLDLMTIFKTLKIIFMRQGE